MGSTPTLSANLPPPVVYRARSSKPTHEGSIPSGGAINSCMNDIVQQWPQNFNNVTDEQIEEFLNALPDTGAGLPGFEVNNVQIDRGQEEVIPCLGTDGCNFIIDDNFVIEDGMGEPTVEPMIIGGVGVTNNETGTETVREYEAFGVKLNDADDVISVGIVLAVVGLIYIGKCCIDLFFAIMLERWKNGR